MPNLDFTQLIIGFSILLVSLTVHEAAHAWSADQLGDPTARRLGRVSLNPAVHIDLIGTVIFPLIAIVTNLPLIGWAKPVPVSVAALGANWRGKFMTIAAAGPSSNVVLATIAAVVIRLIGDAGVNDSRSLGDQFGSMLVTMIYVNVLLAVFNMIPVPPLDGGNVLAGLLRGPAAAVFDRLRPYGFLILYGLMLTGLLTTIISPPASFLLTWLL